MNRQKGLVPILIVLLIAAAVGGYLIYTNYSNNRNKVNLSTPTPTDSVVSPAPTGVGETTNSDLIGANWETYTSKGYKYTFEYPHDFYIETTAYSVLLKKGSQDNLDALIEILPEQGVVRENKTSFEDFSIQTLKTLCLADGPNSSTYCDEVI